MTTKRTLPPIDEMRRAYLASDPSYDGIFVLAVRTTGIFCRPSCRARKPKPENVAYFAAAAEAMDAGFRPCKRCRPLESDGRPPEWIASLLKQLNHSTDARITEADLRARGLEPARVRRFFRDHFGTTFQRYCRTRRLGDALMQIKVGKSIDAVALDVGFESVSGFRDAFVRQFGKPPGTACRDDFLAVAWHESPLGPLLLAASSAGLCLLEFTDRQLLAAQLNSLQVHFPLAVVPTENAVIEQMRSELSEYFTGIRTEFTVPLVYRGSPFQVRVWDALRGIPYGETWSYEQLACEVGSPRASRAVGSANGMNRIAIVIPCHRVVNKDGKLGGYGGGLWRKQYLLELERGIVPQSEESACGS